MLTLVVLLVGAAVATVWVRFRAGLWQAWVISVSVLVTLGLTAFDEIAACCRTCCDRPGIEEP